MSLTKKTLKTRPVCKVTFTLPPAYGVEAGNVVLVGDFNEWSQESHPLKKTKGDGRYSVTLDLPVNESFQFRYLIDGSAWINDDEADEYIPSPFGNESNSVVRT